MLKHLPTILISAAVSTAIHYLLPVRLPDTIRCDYIEARSIESRQVLTGYVSVRDRERFVPQGSITLHAGPDYAGINVSDGKTVEAFWVEERFGHSGVVEK